MKTPKKYIYIYGNYGKSGANGFQKMNESWIS